MENEQNLQMTSFDSMVQNRHMQMLKAAIPYINASQQKMVSVYIKYWELQRTMELFDNPETSVQMCAVSDDGDMSFQMLNDIKAFCTEEERDSIDMLLNFMQMFTTYESIFH